MRTTTKFPATGATNLRGRARGKVLNNHWVEETSERKIGMSVDLLLLCLITQMLEILSVILHL